MKSSKFNVAALNLVSVQTGIKGSNELLPVITTLGIPNKFQLNRLATTLMGLKVGDRVRIFNNKNAEDISEKYFIAKVGDDDATGAKLGKSNSTTKASSGVDMTFNYSGVWSVCLQGEANAAELGFDALAEKGLVITDKTSGGKLRHRATQDIKFIIEEVGVMEVEGVELTVFALTNYKATDKVEDEKAEDTKSTEEDTEEDTDVDFEEDTDDMEE